MVRQMKIVVAIEKPRLALLTCIYCVIFAVVHEQNYRRHALIYIVIRLNSKLWSDCKYIRNVDILQKKADIIIP